MQIVIKARQDFEEISNWFYQKSGMRFTTLSPKVFKWNLVDYPQTDFSLWHELIARNTITCNKNVLQYLHVLGANASGGMVGSEHWGCNHILPGKACIADGFAFTAVGLEPYDYGFPSQPWFTSTRQQANGARAHELGHAFGNGIDAPLPHTSPGENNIMQEWWDYPNCGLNSWQISQLKGSTLLHS